MHFFISALWAPARTSLTSLTLHQGTRHKYGLTEHVAVQMLFHIPNPILSLESITELTRNVRGYVFLTYLLVTVSCGCGEFLVSSPQHNDLVFAAELSRNFLANVAGPDGTLLQVLNKTLVQKRQNILRRV